MDRQLRSVIALVAILGTFLVAGCGDDEWTEGEPADQTSLQDAMADRGMTPEQQQNLQQQATPDAR